MSSLEQICSSIDILHALSSYAISSMLFDSDGYFASVTYCFARRLVIDFQVKARYLVTREGAFAVGGLLLLRDIQWGETSLRRMGMRLIFVCCFLLGDIAICGCQFSS